MGNIPISDLKVCVENAGKRCENLYLGIGDNQILTFSEMAGVVGTKKLFLTFSGDGVEESQVVEVEVRKRTITEWLDKLLSKLLSFFE